MALHIVVCSENSSIMLEGVMSPLKELDAGIRLFANRIADNGAVAEATRFTCISFNDRATRILRLDEQEIRLMRICDLNRHIATELGRRPALFAMTDANVGETNGHPGRKWPEFPRIAPALDAIEETIQKSELTDHVVLLIAQNPPSDSIEHRRLNVSDDMRVGRYVVRLEQSLDDPRVGRVLYADARDILLRGTMFRELFEWLAENTLRHASSGQFSFLRHELAAFTYALSEPITENSDQ